MSTNNSRDRAPEQAQPDKYEVAYTMQQHGTPFIKALAVMIIHSDDDRLRRIRWAFRKEWAEYSEKAREVFRRKDGPSSD